MPENPTTALCACGCGGHIIPQAYHKYYGTPRFIIGHARRLTPKKTYPPRACATCGATFTSRDKRQQYCSHRCSEIRPRLREANCRCEQCGVAFWRKPSNVAKGTARFCSRACKNAAKGDPHHPRTCAQCGVSFLASTSNLNKGDGRYCSRACGYAARTVPDTARFWAKVERTPSCWLWRGACKQNGYGTIALTGGGSMSTHRFSWMLHHGAIPDGLHVCHTCDVRNCIRPDHLWLGTAYDNIHDCMDKGRTRTGTRRLTADQVRAIRREYVPRVVTQSALAQRYGVAEGTIQHIIAGRNWRGVQ